ncbi:hypothetical protein H4R24_005103 [Coemansia sp. RSA 988]|nr:hypothetical protein H4R24_005103 [Coemansia sp. RSA 988]
MQRRSLATGILAIATVLVQISLTFSTAYGKNTLIERIVGGNEVKNNDYGFAVRLNIDAGEDSYLCGGTLISSSLVVTAAHCMVDADTNTPYEAKQVNVCYGANSVVSQSCTTARNLTVHPQYNAKYLSSDIALIQIARLSDATTASIYTGELKEGDKITTMGWGKTASNSDTLPTTLMSVEVKVGSKSKCNEGMPTYNSPNGPEICSDNALTPGKDSCQGDSGSPAVISDGGEPKLVGLTSSGVDLVNPGAVDCATKNGLAFYTHVAYYLDFIAEVSGQPISAFTSGSSRGDSSHSDESDTSAADVLRPRLAAAMLAAAAAGMLVVL